MLIHRTENMIIIWVVVYVATYTFQKSKCGAYWVTANPWIQFHQSVQTAPQSPGGNKVSFGRGSHVHFMMQRSCSRMTSLVWEPCVATHLSSKSHYVERQLKAMVKSIHSRARLYGNLVLPQSNFVTLGKSCKPLGLSFIIYKMQKE